MYSNLCSTFFLLAREEDGEGDPAGDAVKSKRCDRTEGHLHCKLGGGSRLGTGPSTPERELDELCSNVGKVGMFTIMSECRTSEIPGSVDKILGKQCAVMPENVSLLGEFVYVCISSSFNDSHLSSESEVQQRILANVNVGWTSKHSCDLLMYVHQLNSVTSLRMC